MKYQVMKKSALIINANLTEERVRKNPKFIRIANETRKSLSDDFDNMIGILSTDYKRKTGNVLNTTNLSREKNKMLAYFDDGFYLDAKDIITYLYLDYVDLTGLESPNSVTRLAQKAGQLLDRLILTRKELSR